MFSSKTEVLDRVCLKLRDPYRTPFGCAWKSHVLCLLWPSIPLKVLHFHIVSRPSSSENGSLIADIGLKKRWRKTCGMYTWGVFSLLVCLGCLGSSGCLGCCELFGFVLLSISCLPCCFRPTTNQGLMGRYLAGWIHSMTTKAWDAIEITQNQRQLPCK